MVDGCSASVGDGDGATAEEAAVNADMGQGNEKEPCREM